MEEEITVMPMQQRQIREAVKDSKKFLTPNDFLKSAIEILLAWESEHPEDCIELIKNLRPLSQKQEQQIMTNTERVERRVGELDLSSDIKEIIEQQRLAQSDYDHLKAIENFENTIEYIKSLKIVEPENIIPYDGYPLLSLNYRRFLPVKLVTCMLAHLLASKRTTKIELKELRVNAYDILEEYGIMIRRYEKEHDIPRNNKISTSLPRKTDFGDERDLETKIRIKDIEIGKTRNSRILDGRYFDGALSAMGLVYAFEESDKEFISLTEIGKKFILINNPIFPKNDFTHGALSLEETEFILKEIIPQRELEHNIVKKIIKTVREFDLNRPNSKTDLEILESEIHATIKEYIARDRQFAEKYNILHLDEDEDKTQRKIEHIRLVTMGRLSELGIIKWEITPDSASKYSIAIRKNNFTSTNRFFTH